MLMVIEGEGAINNLKQRTAREPVVQVVDENNQPVKGAVVQFSAPTNGPSAAFAGGLATLTVMTDALGRASAKGLRANNIAGEYTLTVRASYHGWSDSKTIKQTNALVGAAGAGAAGGTAAAAGGILASKALIAGIAVVAAGVGTAAAIAVTQNSSPASASAPPQ